MEARVVKDVDALNERVSSTETKFLAFRDDYFPKYMTDFQEMVVQEVAA